MGWIRKLAALAAMVCVLGGMVGVMSAKAQHVRFAYRGGRWSHHRHGGWHRYWGGPTVGFYWAPEPVYIVRGYDDPTYYTGPDYWYSNPSYGFSYSVANGGWYDHDRHFHRFRRGFHRERFRDHRR